MKPYSKTHNTWVWDPFHSTFKHFGNLIMQHSPIFNHKTKYNIQKFSLKYKKLIIGLLFFWFLFSQTFGLLKENCEVRERKEKEETERREEREREVSKKSYLSFER